MAGALFIVGANSFAKQANGLPDDAKGGRFAALGEFAPTEGRAAPMQC